MSGDESARSKKEWKYFTKIGVTVFLTFACCIIFFFAILRYEGFAKNWNKIMQAAQPITTGLVLAYIFNPVLGFFENIAGNLLKKRVKDDKKRKKYSRGIGVAASIIVLILFITLLIAAIVPAVIDSVRTMLETLPENVESLIYQIQHGKLGKSQIADIVSNYITIGAEKIEDWAKNYLMPEAQHYIAQITTGVISVVKGIFNFVIGIIVMAYVMTIKERLKGQSKKIIYAAFKPKVGNLIVEAVRKTNEIFGGFITGKSKTGVVALPRDRAIMLDALKDVKKPIVAFKFFAGGQALVEKTEEERREIIYDSYDTVFSSLKENDFGAIGIFQKYHDQLKEDVSVFNSWAEKRK